MRTRSIVEVRWLCTGPLPGPVTAWFESLPGRSRSNRRVDAYWAGAPLGGWGPGSSVKLRGVVDRRGRPARRRLRLEVKVLEWVGGPVGGPGLEGRAEVWCKAAARVKLRPDEEVFVPPGGPGGGWLPVVKHRRRRRVGSANGKTAQLEVTELRVARRAAWSVALYAVVPPPPQRAGEDGFPPGPGDVAIRATVAAVLTGPAFAEWPASLPLDRSVCRSYAEWLHGQAVAVGGPNGAPPSWLTEAAARLAEACPPGIPEAN